MATSSLMRQMLRVSAAADVEGEGSVDLQTCLVVGTLIIVPLYRLIVTTFERYARLPALLFPHLLSI